MNRTLASILIGFSVSTSYGIGPSTRPDSEHLGDREAVRQSAQAEQLLRLALSADRPSRAVVFEWTDADLTLTLEEVRRRVAQAVPVPARETSRQREQREANVELNAQNQFREAQEGRLVLLKYRRSSEGVRVDIKRFEIGDEVAPTAAPDLTWLIPPSGGSAQLVSHEARRRFLMKQRPAEPRWLLEGGRNTEGLRLFFKSAIRLATGQAVEDNAEIKPEWTQLLLSPPGTVEKWPWQTTLETREDGSVVFRASLPNHKEAMIEAVFPDERLQTVRTFISRNPTTGEEMFRREVQRTNEEGIPLEFWVEEAQVGGKPPKRTRYVIEEWVVAEERGGPPLVTEDWSDYTDGRMPR